MPRKTFKGNTENLNLLKNKISYIGFELGEVPEFLKDFTPLNYNVPKIYDETTLEIDYMSYEKDISLKGEFIRLVLSQDLSQEEQRQIITTGIKALSGEEVN